MNTRRKIACAGLCLLGSWAHASDFYFGVELGAADYDDVAETGASQDGLSLNGLNFDSTESAFGLHVGWRARSWLAVELGYSDLGNSGIAPQAPSFNRIPDAALLPMLLSPSVFLSNPVIIDPGSFQSLPFPVGLSMPLFLPTQFPGTFARPASIEASQWHVGAKLSTPVRERLHAHWYLGLARTSFDADGTISLLTFEPGQTSPTTVQLQNADPGDETGVNWGFGFDWSLNDRFDLGADWRRRDTGVLEIDTYTLRLTIGL